MGFEYGLWEKFRCLKIDLGNGITTEYGGHYSYELLQSQLQWCQNLSVQSIYTTTPENDWLCDTIACEVMSLSLYLLYHLKHPVHRIYLQYRSSTNTRTWPACFFVISSIGLLFQSGRCI